MNKRAVSRRILLIGLLVALAVSAAHARRGLLEVEAEASPDNVPRGNAVAV